VSVQKLKGFGKDAVLYGVGDVIGRLSGLLMLPILSRAFTTGDYGVIDLLTVGYAFVLLICQLGVPSGLQRHYYLKDTNARKLMLTSCVVPLVVSTLPIAGVVVIESGRIAGLIDGSSESISKSLIVLAICLPIEIVWTFLILLLKLDRMPVTFSVVNTVYLIMSIAATYYLVTKAGAGLQSVFMAKLITLSIMTTLLLIYRRRDFAPKVDLKLFFEVTSFGIAGLPGLMMTQGMVLLPRYLLMLFAPLSAVGILGIATRIGSIMSMYTIAFNRAWNPFAYQNAGATDERKLYEMVFKLFSTSLVVTGLLLSLFSSDLLSVLTPDEYHEAHVLVPGLVFYLAIEGAVLIYSTLLYTNSRVRWASYLEAVRMIVFIVAGITLIPLYHAVGVVIAMDIAAFFYMLCYSYATLSFFRFQIPFARLSILLILSGATILVFRVLDVGLISELILKLLTTVAMGIFGLWFVLEKHERQYVTRCLKVQRI